MILSLCNSEVLAEMKSSYTSPEMDVRKYNFPYNSVFTDSGDPHDDDEFDLGGGSGGNLNNEVFGN